MVLCFKVADSVSRLGVVLYFGAQNCQLSTKVDARLNFQLTTSPAIEPNACKWLGFCPIISK
jgi:hypothetical protein